MEEIILVDEKDNPVGTGDKMEVHMSGKLHRAFSIFIFNSKGELMLQKRAASKYHCGGLWTNTCCSHPRAGESLDEAIHRRLKEEMGFDCAMQETFSFIYKAELDHSLVEFEFDHVFLGRYDGNPSINPEEADGWKWIGLDEVKEDILKNPEAYTPWFKIALSRITSEQIKKTLAY